jgi:hypothetical protein
MGANLAAADKQADILRAVPLAHASSAGMAAVSGSFDPVAEPADDIPELSPDNAFAAPHSGQEAEPGAENPEISDIPSRL